MCACVHVYSMYSQMAQWILAKHCRHYPWMPTMVFHQKNDILKNITSEGGGGGGGEEEEFKYPFERAFKTVAQWLSTDLSS